VRAARRAVTYIDGIPEMLAKLQDGCSSASSGRLVLFRPFSSVVVA
jgi:hypothetical protein